jgi:hypothetical protein
MLLYDTCPISSRKSAVIDTVGLINRIGKYPSNNKLSWHFKLTA